tara:strand:+ start:735 stop:2042 length:1308 start_codon:yes stop_codon:yes gene_type:complete
MKKFLLALFATITVANPILAQKNNSNSDKGDGLLAVGALALGAAAAALEYQLWLEEVELMAFRHILDSRPGESACRVKLLTSDAKKMTDNSSSQAMVFAITFFDEKQQEVIRNEVLVMMLYPGYIMYSGLEYSKLQWFWFDEYRWADLKQTFLEMSTPAVVTDGRVKLYGKINESEFGALPNQFKLKKGLAGGKEEFFQETGESVPLEALSIRMKGFKAVGAGLDGSVPYYWLRNDDYIYKSLDEEISLIANERALGFYFKDVGRVIQISRVDVGLIESFIYDWDLKEEYESIKLEYDGKILTNFCTGRGLSIDGKGYLKISDVEYEEFSISGLAVGSGEPWKTGEELYYRDKDVYKGKIVEAAYDASRPYLEIEYLQSGKSESKKVSTLNEDILHIVDSALCPQVQFMEVKMQDGSSQFLEVDDGRVFGVQGKE